MINQFEYKGKLFDFSGGEEFIEVANYAALPVTGESSKIYVTLDNNKLYRWTGSTYVELSGMTIDANPTDGSANAVSSNGVFDVLSLKQNSLGFTAEDVANKQTDLTASATKYPTVNAVNTGLGTKQNTLVSGNNIRTINGNTLLGSTDLVINTPPSGLTGQIQFNNGGSFGADSNLFWDNTNKRLGIGATPATTVRLDVRAQGALSTDIAFRVRNSADNANLIEVQGTGFINVINTINHNVGGGSSSKRNIIQDTGNDLIFTYNRPGVDNCISVGYSNTLSNASSDFMNNFGSNLNTSGQKSTNIGYNNILVAATSFILGRNFNVTAGSNNILIGSRAATSRGISGSNFIWIGSGSEANPISCSSALFTYFDNAANPNHILRRRGNIALVGEKYQIISDASTSTGLGLRMDINAENTLTIHNGTSPEINITDAFQLYSADITAGNAAPHFRTENGNVIKLYRETTAVVSEAFVANTSAIVNDSATYGGYTMGQVVAALKAQGLLA